jgi:DNA-directed RNA polymerase subunit H (RpoH/RPB5)
MSSGGTTIPGTPVCPKYGENMSLMTIQHEYKPEYNALGKEEHKEIVKEYKENIQSTKHITHPPPCGCIQDFGNIVCNIVMLVVISYRFTGLKTHVGIEGFFCIMQKTSMYSVQPQWLFTSETLAGYMKIASKKWSTHNIQVQMHHNS